MLAVKGERCLSSWEEIVTIPGERDLRAVQVKDGIFSAESASVSGRRVTSGGSCLWGCSPGHGGSLRGSVDLDSEQWPDLLRQMFEMEIFYIYFLSCLSGRCL